MRPGDRRTWLPRQKKVARQPELRQGVEQRGSGRRIRAVVEGQGHVAGVANPRQAGPQPAAHRAPGHHAGQQVHHDATGERGAAGGEDRPGSWAHYAPITPDAPITPAR